MKIESVELTNIRNHEHTEIELSQINIFSGLNNSGKSSIKAAIEYALTGRCQWTDGAGRGAEVLVSHGTKAGNVKLDIEGLGVVSRSIPGTLQVADWTGSEKVQQTELCKTLGTNINVIQALLNSYQFINLAPGDQKNMLFKLAGLQLDDSIILLAVDKFMHTAKGQVPTADFMQYTHKIIGEASGGPEVLDNLYKVVYAERTGAKKTLKELEALASVKPGESKLPAGAMENKDQIKTELKKVKQQKEELLQAKAKAESAGGLRDRISGQIAEADADLAKKQKDLKGLSFKQGDLDLLESSLPDAEKDAESKRNVLDLKRQHMANNEANLKMWTDARDRMKKNVTATCPLIPGYDCPADQGEMMKSASTKADAAAKLVEENRQEIVLLERDAKDAATILTDAQKRLSELRYKKMQADTLTNEIKSLKKRLEGLRKEQQQMADAPAAENYDEEIDALAERIPKGEALLQQIIAEEAVRAERLKVTASLEKQRQAVEWLELLVEAFGAKGIKAAMLEKVIGGLQAKVNERLGMLTAGKYAVRFDLEKDFQILVAKDGQETGLANLSTSERLRVGIALQDALSGLTGLRFMVIDDCETLDPYNKRLLTNTLMKIKGEYDTIIILSAMGETEPMNPGIPGLSVFFVDNGTVRLIPAQAAA